MVAGQKSGIVYGFNPDGGAIVWQSRGGRGVQRGMHFGMAAGDGLLYVPINDMFYPEDRKEWCDEGISAPATAIPGGVIAGHMDGRVRIYAAKDGKVLWDYSTLREFETVSGEVASGGSMSGSGATGCRRHALYEFRLWYL